MINREIVYERNLTGSFMKIPVGMKVGLDERLMLRRKLPGLLPVEKAYMDGKGQYWYNISGKQSLDTYCRVKEIDISFIEKLIISICSELEILEWNLIHTSCLMLDPELIFITNSNREFIFTVYPGGSGTVETEFQQMMEYLLTRIDHKDGMAVKAAYGIYEKTLQEGYTIVDIRDSIMEARQAKDPKCIPRQPEPRMIKKESSEAASPKQEEGKERTAQKEKKKLGTPEPKKKKRTGDSKWVKIIKKKLVDLGILEQREEKEEKPVRKKNREAETEVVFPEDEVYVLPEPIIHPTVCLSSLTQGARGRLVYQGNDSLPDICIEARTTQIGYGREADIRIDRDTISQIHAKIDREEDAYYIEDLNSTNGTFVNEELLAYKERRKLNSNDMVQFADVRYRFH